MAIASAILIVLFSTLIYKAVQNSLYQEIQDQLIKQANYIKSHASNFHIGQRIDNNYLKKTLNISVEVIAKPSRLRDDIAISQLVDPKTKTTKMVLFYPYNFQEQSYLKITKDITSVEFILKKLYRIIIFTNILAFAFIIIYAAILSNYLTTYIMKLTKKLSTLNENMLKPIKVKDLPLEFQPLGRSINMLINRVQTFVKYQKELFIGIAHELKTPLAVMKLKNEVTLIKEREPQEYIKTLKLNIQTINEMNKMIENILKIGRQESDQFEPPVEIDLIAYLKEKANNYKLLAKSEGKELIIDLKPTHYLATIQPTLLNHIIQNFIQNAIKFTKEHGTITLRSYPVSGGIKIEVIDEGPGIDESIDLFAPFKRIGEKGGVGLGLFLARSAADAMGAKIDIRNRKDVQGAVASLFIPTKLACPIC